MSARARWFTPTEIFTRLVKTAWLDSLKLRPTGYREKGRFRIQQDSLPTWTHPVVAGGRLYLRDQDTIYAYDVREKK